jgi:hypothetical protein
LAEQRGASVSSMTACTILPGRTSSGPKQSGVASYATWSLPAARLG